MSVIKTGRAQVAIKQEANAGTAETLAAADGIMPKGEVSWEPDVQMTAREAMTAALSPRGSVPGARKATIKFAMFLRGSYSHTTGAGAAVVAASTEPDFSVPFKGCGLNLTVSGGGGVEQASYKPSSTTIQDETTGAFCTVAMYMDGKRYMIHGAVGNCVITCTVGQPVLAEFEFQGVYNTPTDAALLSGIVYPTVIEPPFLSAAFSVPTAVTTAKLQSFKLDFGNQITMRPNPNLAAGYFTAQITGRKPAGSFDPEETLVSVKDWYAEWIAGAPGAITTGVFPSNGSNNNQFQINVGAAIYTKVGLTGRDGIATAPHDFECTAVAAAGDDEFEIIQT